MPLGSSGQVTPRTIARKRRKVEISQGKPYPLIPQGSCGSPIARRWPHGVPRDGNAMAAQYPARLPVRCLAALPRNFPVKAGHWQRRCRRMSVETTRKTTCLAPDLAAPCPHWKLARLLATWPRTSQGNISQAARRILVVSFYP